MPKQSAGILLYRKTPAGPEFFLVHPGGPFFKNKDDGAWSIPKGEFTDDEDALTAAKREFDEETGSAVDGEFIPLTPVKLKSGKIVQAWAVEGDIDHTQITSNTFTTEWPPKSGKMQAFPEVDRASWFGCDEAKQKINAAQVALLEELHDILNKE
jgi:predicted NUDIX family NTP pyrophosphohydrolase